MNNSQIYKFPEQNSTKEIKQLSDEYDNIIKNNNYEINKDEVYKNGIFNTKIFNTKVDNIIDLERKKRAIRHKIKLAKLKYQPLDYKKLTIEELEQGYINDMFDMFNELYNFNEFSLNKFLKIFNKNYRILTILLSLLFLLLIFYFILNISTI
jgi:hypothetical protein